MASPRPLAGLLLTGGKSTRMGRDKAGIVFEGEPLAVRIGRMLAGVAKPVFEVGGGWSGLATAADKDPGEGPLTGIVTGWHSLRALGHTGDVIVVATDLPWLTPATLQWLAAFESGVTVSVVPVVAGRGQPLCARWCRADLDRAAALVSAGVRLVREALGPETAYPDETAWGAIATPNAFRDVDRPDELPSSE